ncbi:nucleotidyltransferase domain-containing protein [Candidatus Woesearchaeota archaeon]|nr:nucleotidyltransferase domain-containing protein [Candidatus Woesearchaeota archaeon]
MISKQNKFEYTLSLLQEKFAAHKEIEVVYLYGSVSRGDYSLRHSDLDLLLILSCTSNKKIEEKIKNALISLGLKNGVKIQIEFIGKNITEEDHSLLRKVIEEGKVLYAKGTVVFDHLQLGLRQFIVYSYSLKKSTQKSYFSKVLHGRKSWYYEKRKNGKREKIVKEYAGIIDNNTIFELGRGALLVAKERQKDMLHVFEQFGVVYEIKRIVYG